MEAKNGQIEGIRKEFEKIISSLAASAYEGQRIDQAERQIFRDLPRLGLMLVRYYFELLAESASYKETVGRLLGEGYSSKGRWRTTYWSVFGKFELLRSRYFQNGSGTGCSPLDEAAGLPEQVHSYVLDDWLGAGSAEMDYRQATARLERILGHGFAGTVAQRRTEMLAEEVDGYCQGKAWSALEGEGEILCAGFDGKGVPIVLEERGGRAAEAAKKTSKAARLGKGQKKGVKKEATVSVDFSLERRVRTVEEIEGSLFDPPQAGQRPTQRSGWSQNKHLRAFLSDQKGAIGYGVNNLLERDPTASKPIVFLTDGSWGLINAMEQAVEDKGLGERVLGFVLDIIHVLEYVWKVANAMWGEKHPEREKWVRSQFRLLLESRAGDVISLWGGFLEREDLTSSQRETVEKSITYLSNHRNMMDYKTYLAQGLPISTGIVESACGHLVKTRMEKNGMRWGTSGAQAMLNTRSVYKNGDWDGFMQYFIEKEQSRIYPLKKRQIAMRA
jgi:hypothetical protein